MSLYVPPSPLPQRDKLGLALAGGGFRASLFHIGVMRRLAEMDVLRYVEVLSTVSGGSIIGALYILMLKKQLDTKPSLTRDEYVTLVKDLEKDFVAGVQNDLRTRLLMNPLGMLGVLTSYDSLSNRMGRIYDRYIYKRTVDALVDDDSKLQRNWLSRELWPGRIPLQKVRFMPGGKEIEGGIESYNQSALYKKDQAKTPGSAIPDFIMNATALNSGAPFRLSSNEIGDPRLGYFRYDEINCLTAYKDLLERPSEDLTAMIDGTLPLPVVKARMPHQKDEPLLPRDAELARCWLARNDSQPILPTSSKHWTLVCDSTFSVVLSAMCKTNFGRLRQLKLPAWYVRRGAAMGITGGVSQAQHLIHFNQVLGEIEPTAPDDLAVAITSQTPLGAELLEFAMALYYLRSAEVMSPRLRRDFDRISLGTAVAASANFPPVFPPLVLLGIYDDLHITRLGLSDGGVYDNMGITTLLDEGCTYIIASDTGAPFDVMQRVNSRYLGMIGRLPSVLTEDVAEQQRTELRERRRVSAALAKSVGANGELEDLRNEFGLRGLAFFSVDSLDLPGEHGIDLSFSPMDVALLRTDLDAFGDMEVAALVNTGYDHADQFVSAYFANSPFRNSNWTTPPAAPPHPSTARFADHIARVLEVGKSRLFRPLMWLTPRSWPSWLFVLVMLAILLVRFGKKSFSVQELVNRISAAILIRLENPLPRVPFVNRHATHLIIEPMTVRELVIGMGVLLILILGWPKIAKLLQQNRSPTLRKVATVAKWARAFAPALFLLFDLTPVWIALAACIVGWVSYGFFSKPYLWATRMK
jgi:predicted acylesterase/phospholipase RssA